MLWEVRMTTVRKICSIMNAMEDTNWLSVLLAAQLYDAAGFSQKTSLLHYVEVTEKKKILSLDKTREDDT